jgi:RHS repeat-associated protein
MRRFKLAVVLLAIATFAGAVAGPVDARTDRGAGRTADVIGTIVAGGDPLTVTITSTNDDGRISFEGTTGQRVSLSIYAVTMSMSFVSILKPDGSNMSGSQVVFSSGKFFDTMTLPVTGTYTILIEPYATGSMTLKLYDVPADASGTITPGGPAATIANTVPGQNGRLTFTGSPGQRVALNASVSNIGGGTNGAFAAILNPDGSTLTTTYPNLVMETIPRFLDTKTLAQSGTYTVLFDPSGGVTGSGTFTLHSVPADATGTIATDGVAVSIANTVPGQDGRLTFSGIEGRRVSLKATGSGFVPSNKGAFVSILKPDGTPLMTSYPYQVMNTVSQWLDTKTLPTTGTYTVFWDGWEDSVGTGSIRIWDVPADVTGPVATGGASVTANLNTPGQNARFSFYGSAGQPVKAFRTTTTFGWMKILKPDGTDLASTGLILPPNTDITATLPSSGTYTLLSDLGEDSTGSVTLRLEANAPFQPPERTRGSCDARFNDFTANCGTMSDPVNTLTGAFTNETTDFSLPGAGVPFTFTRWYDSSDPTIGRLGAGWSDSLFASLTVQQPSNDVIVHSENGQQGRFYRQSDGTYVGEPGALSQLVAVDGGHELTRHDQTKLRFDSQGRLTSMKDRTGDGLTLAYGGDGRLATVTDAAGRQVTFTHDGDGRLTEIALPGGLTLGFGYTGGRLTSVTDVKGGTTAYRYDAGGRLDQITDPRGNLEVRNTYNADGRVTQQLDALGNATTFAWDAATQTATVTDARNSVWKDVYSKNVLIKRIDGVGNATEFGHDNALNDTTVKMPSGQTTTMTYDSRGNVLTATAPASLGTVQKTFAYNARNDVVSVTDARGKVTTYGYDANGNNTTIVRDGQTLATKVYNAAGLLTSSTDGRNNTTTFAYDANGNMTSRTNALGEKATYTYDAAGRLTSMVEPRGNVQGANPNDYKLTYTYDAAGHLLTETDPLGHVATYAYDAAGNRTSVTDPNNKTTTYVYDAANRVSTRTAADGGITTYTHDTVGNKLTEKDANNNTTTYTYDAANRLTSVTTPLGNKTTYAYDANGNLASMVEPRGNVQGANPNEYKTTYTSDAAGRLLTETDPLGNASVYGYDAVGNRTSVRDANNHTTTYSYDGLNRLQSVTAPGGAATTYAYDAAGNVLSRTDANNHVTAHAYDGANRLTATTFPLNRVWTHSYDAAGNAIQTVDANGNATQTAGDGTVTNTYDRAGRLTAIAFSGSTPDVTFSYDAAGNRTQMTDGQGTQSYTYDGVDRLKTVTRGQDVFSYDYDLNGNPTRRTYPDGTDTDYTYDADRRLATAVSGGQTTSYAYDAAGNVTQTTLPAANGHVEERTYDRAGRLTRLRSTKGANTLVDLTYTLDAVGNPTQVVRAGTAAGTTTYVYDARDRLTDVCFQASCPGGADPFIRWTYDGVGNRLTEARPSATTNYTYNAGDQLSAAGSTSFDYDANGNQTQAGARAFVYDGANRPTSTTSGGATTTYAYDGDGNRAQETAGGQTRKLLWDTNRRLPQLALERNGQGAVLGRYVYGRKRISMTAGGATSYFHYDNVGSVVNMTSSGGGTAWTYAYEPFGAVRAETHDDPSAPDNSLKFTGELLDETGLYYLRARQYDPASGRFTTRDPVSSPRGDAFVSLYAYAADRPTVYVDPSGMTFEPDPSGQLAADDAASPDTCPVGHGDELCPATEAFLRGYGRELASASKASQCTKTKPIPFGNLFGDLKTVLLYNNWFDWRLKLRAATRAFLGARVRELAAYSVNAVILANRDYHANLPSNYTFHAQLRRWAYVGEGAATHVLRKGQVFRMGVEVRGHRTIRGRNPFFLAVFRCEVDSDPS